MLNDTQKRVGAPYCTNFDFFSLICSSEKHMVLGAYIDDRLIGISVFLIDEAEVFYYLNGTDIEFRNFSQNYLMLWHAIKYSAANNIKFFNLGASHYNALKDFKKKWGTKEYKMLTLYEN
jgi:lipid II:glycine glycyltransferase (peptidoglycan interpeptide bridge formation enzyme)